MTRVKLPPDLYTEANYAVKTIANGAFIEGPRRRSHTLAQYFKEKYGAVGYSWEDLELLFATEEQALEFQLRYL